MKSNHLPVPLFLMATVLVDLTVVSAVGSHRFPMPGAGVILGLVLGQVGLLATWLVLGGRSLLLRLITTLAGAALLAIPSSECSVPTVQQWMAVLFVYGTMVAAPLVVLRILGMRLLRTCHQELSGKPEKYSRRWQFSIGSILLWTTCVGIVLGVLRLLDFPWTHALAVVVYCAGFAFVAVISQWTAFSSGSVLLQVTVPTLISPAVGAMLCLIEVGSPSQATAGLEVSYFAALLNGFIDVGSPSQATAVLCAIQAGFLCVAAFVFRTSGYRFTWGDPQAGEHISA